jgi:hypothetical protein
MATKSPRKSPTKKKAAASKGAPAPAKPVTARKAAKNAFNPGTYTVPRGHVSIAVPTHWTLQQSNDDLQVESEQSETTVIVTAYQRTAGVKQLDARDYLEHFLETAPAAKQLKRLEVSKLKAGARFRDEEGDNWLVSFLTNGKTLLLATCHSNRPWNSHEGRTGIAVLDSIKLKARG